jgi:hypothetical protein
VSPEPPALQILKQLLGDDRGTSVFALNMMAGSLAELGQQVQQQAQQIEQMQQAAAALTPPAPSAVPVSENPWTGTNGAGHDPLEAAEATVLATSGEATS